MFGPVIRLHDDPRRPSRAWKAPANDLSRQRSWIPRLQRSFAGSSLLLGRDRTIQATFLRTAEKA
jgi:hypothetical protein